jgi:hypothetical protein
MVKTQILMKRNIQIGIFCLSFLAFNAIAQSDGDYSLDQVYSLADDGTLYLRSEDAQVRITGSDRSDVRVMIERKVEVRGASSRRSFEMQIEEKSGNLYLTERSKSSGWNVGYYRLDYEITIELPMNASLKIDGEDDDYLIKSVQGSIRLQTEDGNVELIDCNGDDFEIELEDGDLRMDGGNGSLYVNVEDGDIDVRNGNFDRVEIITEDGDIMVETNLADKGVYDIDGQDATIELIVLQGGGEFDISKDDARVSVTKEFEMLRDTDSRETFRLSPGTADVRIRTEDGRVRLTKN